jgi:outer membrane protein insertion porin family
MRWTACALALACLFCAGPARADVADYLGKPLTAVRLEAEGRTLNDRELLDLLETPVGSPLRMRDVRASVAHLFSLGRFADVIVHADNAPTGVVIRYELVPIHPITEMRFEGIGSTPGVRVSRVRQALIDQFGASPPANRADVMARFVVARLQERGYRRATATARVEMAHDPERATLAFAVVPGSRTHITDVVVSGPANVPPAEIERRLELRRGEAYEPDVLQPHIEQYVEELKRLGYYNAQVTAVPRLTDDEQSVVLAVNVTTGPRVRIAFTGDSLPADRRDELVPVAREGAVDEDLLEDSSERIVDFLRGQGYRDAAATFSRTTEGDDLVVTFNVTRGPQYRIARVEVTGTEAIALVDLAPALKLRAGQPFSTAALSADVSAVQDFYARRGYDFARAVPQAEPIEEARDAQQVPVAVRIEITEGVRTVVASVRVVGNGALTAGELTAGLVLQPGQPFFPTQLAIDRDAIQLRYGNSGFRNASVTSNPGLSGDGTHADIVFTIEEGPRVYVDHVLIVGNQRTRPETIRRELQFKSGEPLGVAAVTESQRRLTKMGLFRRVRITELGHGVETSRDVLVTVDEAPVTTMSYGGGLEAAERIRADEEQGGVATARIEFAPRAFFEIGRRNLFGKNRSVNLFTRISFRPRDFENGAVDSPGGNGYGFSEYRVIGTYREPRVFGSVADAFLTGTIEQQRRSSFNFARRAFNAELLRRVTREISVSGSYQIQRTELFDEQIEPEDKLLIDRLFPQVRLSSFSASAVRDGRDDLLDPVHGTYLSANGQLAARVIGSEVGFVKSYLTAQLFRPLPGTRRVVMATSARLGVASGFVRLASVETEAGIVVENTVRDLPASERFFAGGDTTVRGFALDQLGTPETIDKDGFPEGGNAVVILNAELRLPVRGGLGVVGFFDTGNVFARTSSIDLGELRSALGFGVRYRSPVGPIRVDVGFKVNRRDIVEGRREDLTAVHISLGQAF